MMRIPSQILNKHPQFAGLVSRADSLSFRNETLHIKVDEVRFGWSAANPPAEEDWHCVVDENNIDEFFEQDESGLWLSKQSLIDTVAEKLEGFDNPRFYMVDVHKSLMDEAQAYQCFKNCMYQLSQRQVLQTAPVSIGDMIETLRSGVEGVIPTFSTVRLLRTMLHRDGGKSFDSDQPDLKILALFQSSRTNLTDDSALNVLGDFPEYLSSHLDREDAEKLLEERYPNNAFSAMSDSEVNLSKAVEETHMITIPLAENCYRYIFINNTRKGVMHGVTKAEKIDPDRESSRTCHRILLKG